MKKEYSYPNIRYVEDVVDKVMSSSDEVNEVEVDMAL